MKTIRIKTHNLNFPHDTNHFFILSKGYNAGKPMDKPCPNCFIVTAENEEHKYQLFWVCYSLWKSGAYLPLLCGTVIPFLHIRDAEREIQKALEVIGTRKTVFEKEVSKLQQLIRTEKLLQLQTKLINELKNVIARKLIQP
jgi:hypothetical protein